MSALRKMLQVALLITFMLMASQCNIETQDIGHGLEADSAANSDAARPRVADTKRTPGNYGQDPVHSWQAIKPYSSAGETIGSIAENDSVFVAVSRRAILMSTNGLEWHSDSCDWMSKVTWNGFSFFIFSSLFEPALVSPDGAKWQEHQTDLSENLWFVEWVGNSFAATGGGMHIQSVWFSLDGFKWRTTAAFCTGTIHSIIAADGGYLGVGGAVMWSKDGADWSTVFDDSCISLQSIASNGEIYVAVGLRSEAVVSVDGSWARVPIPGGKEFRKIIWAGDRFVAVGGSFGGIAHIVSSPDGDTWRTEYCDTAGILLDVSCMEGTCVAVGEGGQLLVSPSVELNSSTCTKKAPSFSGGGFLFKPGGLLLSHILSNAVPSP